jgi:hypothetical protein
MSNGGQPAPSFRIITKENGELRNFGCSPWEYQAVTSLLFLGSGRNLKPSWRLPFRLDTGAFVSAIPDSWLAKRGLRAYVNNLSAEPITFRTAAGQGQGHMASDLAVQFSDDPQRITYRFDFVVTPGLNEREVGLIALRDVLRHFHIQTNGGLRFGPFGEPVELPDLVLVPHGRGEKLAYRCRCPTQVWGPRGLNLACNDCGYQLSRA